jgi:hypothetical protein
MNGALSIYEKEAMAILQALKKRRHYFLGNKVVIKIDQNILKYLSSQRLIEGIQHKFMLKLLQFDYSIEYKKGLKIQLLLPCLDSSSPAKMVPVLLVLFLKPSQLGKKISQLHMRVMNIAPSYSKN